MTPPEYSYASLSNIGGRLLKATALLYSFEDEIDTKNPLEIYLEFGNGVHITIECASDGASIVINPGKRELSPIDIGESGEIVVFDLAALAPWRELLNQTLTASEHIIDGYGTTFGIGLIFGVSRLYVFNLGDDLFVFDSLPLQAIQEEHYQIVPVIGRPA